MLRIALPNRGRLADDTRGLLADAGLEVRSRGDRALTASLGGVFEALLVRPQDIPEFVADGAADVGITGWDLVCESGRPLESLLDLGFGRCRLVVAAREERGLESVDQLADGERVATVFPRLTKAWFHDRKRSIELVPVSGAVEVAPHLGIADVIVDLTETGSTLRVNGLREVATVLESTARLICARRNGTPNVERDAAIDELVTALQSVLAARGRRYLMANVPRARLEEVKRLLPGISGPTVVDVLDGGEVVAVHAVCPAEGLFRTIKELKRLGGTGILVTRIERLLA
ncbi:MAG: ATP phosphoribosyltransferase [Gemmatimonadales bacterium]